MRWWSIPSELAGSGLALLLAGTALAHPAPEAAVARVAPSVLRLEASSSAEGFLTLLQEELGRGVELRLAGDARLPRPARVGSAIAIAPPGHVVTAAYLVEGADEIRVTLADGSRARAELIAIDSASDLALLRLSGVTAPPAPLAGDGVELAPGARLCVIGAGPASRCAVAQGRLVAASRRSRGGHLHDFLQLGPGFSPSSAGAAVVDGQGQVVGMVTALRSGGGALALPAPVIVRLARQMLAKGSDQHPWLGVTIASGPGLEKPEKGVFVLGVVPTSPAVEAGISPGDVILDYQGKPIADMSELARLVAASKPGDLVAIGCRRGSRTWTARTRLVARPEPRRQGGIVVRLASDRPYLGIVTVSGAAGAGEGVLVSEVDRDSPAARAGIKAGDRIVRLAGDPVAQPEELAAALLRRKPDDRVELEVERDGERRPLPVQLERRVEETFLSELPRLHLAIAPAEWEELTQALRRLPGDRRRLGALAVERALSRRGLDDDARRALADLKRELQRMGVSSPGAVGPPASPPALR